MSEPAEQTLALARSAAEAVRGLNHATLGGNGLAQPAGDLGGRDDGAVLNQQAHLATLSSETSGGALFPGFRGEASVYFHHLDAIFNRTDQ